MIRLLCTLPFALMASAMVAGCADETLIPVDNDPRTATRMSTWERRRRPSSIVSTNVRQPQTVILIAVGATSGDLPLSVPFVDGELS